jgi:hypothetical protein
VSGPGEFSFEEAERILGPAAVAEARRSAAEAPPLRPEQLEHLRLLFASAIGPAPRKPAADAA